MRWKGTIAQWEEMCDGCAKCCKITKDEQYACPRLDVCTNRCTIYNKDRTNRELCLKVTPSNVLRLHAVGILPDTCAYVCWAKGEEPPNIVEAASYKPYDQAPEELKSRYEEARRRYLSGRRASSKRR